MSEFDDVPPLSDEARAFLLAHEDTGEPTEQDLWRVESRLRGAPDLARPARRRFRLPVELMAAAALVLALLGARAVVLKLRAPAVEPEVSPVSPVSPIVLPPSAAASPASVPAPAPAAAAATSEGDALVKSAGDLLKRRDVAGALAAAKRCVEVAPQLADCHLMLGSARAAVADESKTAADIERAATSYRRFLELAPADDPRRQKVEDVLRPSVGGAPAAASASLVSGPEQTATRLLRERKYPEAIAAAELCIAREPQRAMCHLRLGSAHAGLASQTGEERHIDAARAAYSRFLELAPPDDPLRASVMAVLGARGSTPPAMTSGGAPPTHRAAVSKRETVRLQRGQEQVLVVPNLVRVAVSDPDVVEVRTMGGGSLLLVGGAEGEAEVLVWLSNGEQRTWLVRVGRR